VGPRSNYCGHCGHLRAVERTPAATTLRQQSLRRIEELRVAARTHATEKRHRSFLDQFERYCTSTLAVDLQRADPLDVVSWLISKDGDARTKVHAVGCARASVCDCPQRLKGNTLSSTVGSLQAALEGAGRAGTYDPVRQIGNPCASRLVTQYVKASAKEQIARGTSTQQSEAFSLDLFDWLLECEVRSGIAAWQARDLIVAYVHLRDALQWSVQFNGMDRSVDVLDLQWEQAELAMSPAGKHLLRLERRLSKTSKPGDSVRPMVIADLGKIPPADVFRLLYKLTEESDLPYGPRRGFIFRAASPSALGDFTKRISHGVAQAQLQTALANIGFASEGISLHSFRASGAIAAIGAGWSVAEVMDLANWSTQEMMEHYTSCRTLITLRE
jgi:integrase